MPICVRYPTFCNAGDEYADCGSDLLLSGKGTAIWRNIINMETVYTLGIDVGSTASKCVLLENGEKITAKSLVSVGAGTSGPERAIQTVFENTSLTMDKISYTLATGYGRNSLMSIADKQMSELSCHALGASRLFPDAHTVIDIGGQDVKVLHIENGMLINFQMNDKCAAGTGRFLDVMARVLELHVEDLEKEAEKSEKPAVISSTCTVFAESEVISQLAQGTSRPDIVKGIHRAIARRVSGLVRRVGIIPDIVMTGGVAQNRGIVEALKEDLGCQIQTSPLTQYAGALGAAIAAWKIASR